MGLGKHYGYRVRHSLKGMTILTPAEVVSASTQVIISIGFSGQVRGVAGFDDGDGRVYISRPMAAAAARMLT